MQQTTTAGEVDLAAVGGVLADRACARIRLAAAGLVTVTPRGRYRYYRLAGPEVGELIENLARLAPAAPVRSLREGTRAHAVRRGPELLRPSGRPPSGAAWTGPSSVRTSPARTAVRCSPRSSTGGGCAGLPAAGRCC